MTITFDQVVDPAEADLHVRLYIERHVESYAERHIRLYTDTGMTVKHKVAVAERLRPGSSMTGETAAKRALATVARRWRASTTRLGS